MKADLFSALKLLLLFHLDGRATRGKGKKPLTVQIQVPDVSTVLILNPGATVLKLNPVSRQNVIVSTSI